MTNNDQQKSREERLSVRPTVTLHTCALRCCVDRFMPFDEVNALLGIHELQCVE